MAAEGKRALSVAAALPRRAAGWFQKGAGDLVRFESAVLALMEAEGDAPWV